MIYHPISKAIRPIQYGPINPIQDDIYPVEVTFYSDAGGLGGICTTKVNYMPEGTTSGNTSGNNIHTSDPNLMQFLTMDCKRNPTLEEIDQYAEKELELKRAHKQQQEKWMDEMMQEEIQAFDAAFQKLVDEGIFQKLVIFDLKSEFS